MKIDFSYFVFETKTSSLNIFVGFLLVKTLSFYRFNRDCINKLSIVGTYSKKILYYHLLILSR